MTGGAIHGFAWELTDGGKPPSVSPAAPMSLPARRRFTADELQMLLGIARLLATLAPLAVAAAMLLLPSRSPPAPRFAGGDVLALLATSAIAGLGCWLTAVLRAAPGFRRRVLLVDGAGWRDAVAATGDDRIVALGPVPSSDATALAAFGHAGIDDAVVPRPLPPDQVAALSYALCDAGVRLHVPAQPDGRRAAGVRSRRFRVYRRSSLTPGRAGMKRAADLVLAPLALLVVAPLFPLLAILVKLSSPGPVFFGQVRVGLRGPFRALKFRTMRQGAHLDHSRLIARHGNMFKLKSDPRVTPIGHFLRRFSLDELPQLLQVLAGDMSLVGPRPPLPEEVERYSLAELRRLGTKPGLTGLWQVSGRSDVPFDQWVELDARYIEHWSPSLELWILAKTLTAVLGGRGAY